MYIFLLIYSIQQKLNQSDNSGPATKKMKLNPSSSSDIHVPAVSVHYILL